MPSDNVPDIGDALYPSFVGVTVTDGITYSSPSTTRIDGKYLLKPIQDELLAHQYALQNINAGNVTAGTLAVARGGTGVGSFTSKAIIVANSGGTALAYVTGTLAITGFDSTSVPVAIPLTAGQSIRCNAGGTGLEAFTPGGTGTVTFVDTGTGLTGGPITGTGTISVATNGITNALFRQGAATSVVGVAGNATANVADIVASGPHKVLQMNAAGTAIAFGTLDITGCTGGPLGIAQGGTTLSSLTGNAFLTTHTDASTFTFLTGDLAIIGFDASNFPVAIPLTAGQSIRCNAGGTGLEAFTPGGTGTVTFVDTGTGLTGGPITGTGTISVATNGITNALFRQSAGLSIVGRSTNSTGDVADITATAAKQVMQMNAAGTTIGFQNLDLSGTLTGVLSKTNGGTGLSALGTALQYLRTNAGASAMEWATLPSGMNVDRQTFTASGTWTKPANCKYVRVICVGGGGGGGSGFKSTSATNTYQGGIGGLAGQVSDCWFDNIHLSSTETVTIGAGGAGGASQTTGGSAGLSGSAGGSTYFGSTATTYQNAKLMAAGGNGGSFTNSLTNTNTATGAFTTTKYPGVMTTSSFNQNQAIYPVAANNPAYGPANGGVGAKVSTTANYDGQKGGASNSARFNFSYTAAGSSFGNGGNGGTTGAGSDGTAGANSSWILFGSGGGGGGNNAGTGYAGGTGGVGGGGGGGGAGAYYLNSGPGGVGGVGCVHIFTYY